MSDRHHSVAVRVGHNVIERWRNYSIVQDMLQPAAEFHLELPNATAELHELCRPDEDVEVRVDDTTIITGLIDERDWDTSKDGGNVLTIAGRCIAGRLVDDAMPLGTINGLNVKKFVEKCLGPWYPGGVTITNTENRRQLRGKGAKLAKVVREPAGEPPLNASMRKVLRDRVQQKDESIPPSQRAAAATQAAATLAQFQARSDFRVTPGMKRWQVIAAFLQDTGLLAWSTANGRQLFVGMPNYDQEPQFTFFKPKRKSERVAEATVISMKIHESMAERYSRIVAVGLGPSDESNFGPKVKHRAIVDHGPGPKGVRTARELFGRVQNVGLAGLKVEQRELVEVEFRKPKTLIVSDDTVRSHADAEALARHEMGLRDAHGHEVTVVVQGHGQDGALFAPDTMATVEEEELGHRGQYLLTRVEMSEDRDNGERATIRLVRKGSVLA